MQGTITRMGLNKKGDPYGNIESNSKKYYFDDRNLKNGIIMANLSIGDWVEFTPSKNYDIDIAKDINLITRTGLFVIGNLCNCRTCFSEINQKSVQLVDSATSATLDSYVEQVWKGGNNGILCYDKNFKGIDSNSSDIAYFLIALGDVYKDKENQQLYEGYIKGIPSALKEHISINQGICVDTKENCLRKLLHYPYELYKKNISDVINYLSGQKQDEDVNQKLVIQSLDKAIKDGTFYSHNNQKKWIDFFKLDDIKTSEEEDIFISSITIKNEFLPQIFVYTEEDLKAEILSLFKYHIGDLEFKDHKKAEEFFEDLAKETIPENWDSCSNNRGYDILKSYLEHTYSRLVMEDKEKPDNKKKIKVLLRDSKGNKIVEEKYRIFNSGLLNTYFRPIFIIGKVDNFQVNIGNKVFKWELLTDLEIHSKNDPIIQKNFSRGEEPTMASYFQSTDQIIFDSSLDIALDDQHICEDGLDHDRISGYKDEYDKVKNDEDKKREFISNLSNKLDRAVERAKLMAQRNYKLAIPQFFRTTGEMQFLLPIYLSDDINKNKEPNCALAVAKTYRIKEVKEVKEGKEVVKEVKEYYYEGKTALTLDMAYNNARLIAKPDIFWLDDWIKKQATQSSQKTPQK